MDRLLRGEIPPGGKCDVKTLATEAGVTRAALYSTYLPLKEEFERRRDQLRQTGVIADPRDGQIERLKQQVRHLQDRVASLERDNGELTAFRVQALSRLAAQYDEIGRIRAAAGVGSKVLDLVSTRHRPTRDL